MLRDVFYYGNKPNVHPRERHAKNLEDARGQATTEHFWIINEFCDYRNFDWDFDFEFLPDEDVWAQDHNNVWPSVYQKDSGTWLCPKNLSEVIVYRNDVEPLKRKNVKTDNWILIDKVDETKFDFGWHPDPTDPPYIYKWGNKYYPVELGSTIEYHVPGATVTKYMNAIAELLPEWDRWEIPDYIDRSSFDFAWRPDPRQPSLIYDFGTQWHKAGGPRYICEGASEIKYIEGMNATALPRPKDPSWELVEGIELEYFDYSWHPDINDDPYIYVFGNEFYKAEVMPSMKYHVPGGTEIKYINDLCVRLKPNKTNWSIPDNIDNDKFNYAWIPHPNDPPYIYQFGTQHQKTGGPRYIVPNATEIKYVDDVKATRLSNTTNWKTLYNYNIEYFDYSWHPDTSEDPYIYVFGNQWHDSQTMPTIEYHVLGAAQRKYVDSVKAKLGPDKTFWLVPENIDISNFDFSWKPNPFDPPYIYKFGTQWQKTGGPEYWTPGATEVKYIDILKTAALPSRKNWYIPPNIDVSGFDFSWHPDSTESNYKYKFGTQWQKTGGPIYLTDDSSPTKYIDYPKARSLPDRSNWIIPADVDPNAFDFSWHPDIDEGLFVYQFGTQHQKTGGPKYLTPGTMAGSPIKYIDTTIIKSKRMPKKSRFTVLNDLIIEDFDYSWHPDDTDKPYIYIFGNTQYPAEKMPTLEYVVSGAKEIKYINHIVAKLGPDKRNWEIPNDIDVSNFDFSWKPDPQDPPYIYQFGTQHQKTGGPKYTVPGSNEIKYVDTQKAIKLENKKKFNILNDYIIEEFDYSWHHDESSEPYIYVFGNQHYAAEIMPTVKYIVPGATKVKYVNDIKATLAPNMSNWKILLDINMKEFDFSWYPDPTSPPYIYVWGNQWNSAEKEPTVEYHTPGATEKKYINDTVATVLPDKSKWKKLHEILDFDFSWRPNPKEPPYIYVFGNQHHSAEKMPTLTYTVKGATDKKYVNEIKANLAPKFTNWNILIPVNKNTFDFSWVPDPYDPPYIYVFGNQWNDAIIEPTVEYIVPGATEKKYITDVVATVLPQSKNFEVLIDVDDFDFSWRPNPKDPPYIYVFGNQWNTAEKEPTIQYKVNGATEYKYIKDIVAITKPNLKLWEIPEGFAVDNFDFSWRPDPYDPPYIYEFATEYADRGGPLFKVKGATEVKYMSHIKATLKANVIPKYVIETTLEDLISQHSAEVFWALQKSINYDNFDFNWRPTKDQEKYVHVFGSPESEKTQTYFINAPIYLEGNIDRNFVEQDKKADEEYLAELFIQPDIFLVDRGNPEAQERFEQLKARFTNISKTRFLNSWVDTINRCINRSNTELCWILNSELDYSNFDFKYYPNPWQLKMVHVFGTQWSHWGTTFMVNRETFAEDTKYIKVIEHLSNLNFVKDRKTFATNNLYDIVVIDHGNKECNDVVERLKIKASGKNVYTVPHDTSYLQTIKNIVSKQGNKKENYLWICSSVCDYTNFTFTYICDPFAKDNLHVFPSNSQKFGDTFLLDVNKTKEIINDLTDLKEYTKVNYNQHQKTRRLPHPVIMIDEDSHANIINYNFEFPYVQFKSEKIEDSEVEPMCLWTEETKNIIVTSTGATNIIAPKEIKNFVEKQLYDYPYIKTSSRLSLSKPLDIVFLSNGEKCADENYEHLLEVTKGLKNRITRIDGINGRVAAYHAALEASNTPWAFTVFAKLKINPKFDFNWQPDRLQIPKHYIFHAKNPVNGLEYGHQGMIAYNKRLTLANTGKGLDFTLDDPHETVQLLSGTANFNTDEYSTWRTAFREVIKLKSDYTDISQDRLKIWLTKAKGKFADKCLQGANDAVEYYNSVSGDIDQLKLSYEWVWLKEYYNRKYK